MYWNCNSQNSQQRWARWLKILSAANANISELGWAKQTYGKLMTGSLSSITKSIALLSPKFRGQGQGQVRQVSKS